MRGGAGSSLGLMVEVALDADAFRSADIDATDLKGADLKRLLRASLGM